MGTEPADIVADLCADIGLKSFVQLIGGAGEHKILPHDQSSFVAHVVEEIIGKVTAAPDAHTVIVGFLGGGKEHVGPLPGLPCEDIVLRNIIRSHGKDLQAVYLKSKVAAGKLLGSPVGDQDFLFPMSHQHTVAVVPVLRLIFHVLIIDFLRHGIGVDSHGAQADFLLP